MKRRRVLAINDQRRPKLIPNAIEMVYDNYNALVVGFFPGMRPSEAIASIAVMPEWVNSFFLQGAGLPDPEKLLSGTGNVARHIKMEKGAARHWTSRRSRR